MYPLRAPHRDIRSQNQACELFPSLSVWPGVSLAKFERRILIDQLLLPEYDGVRGTSEPLTRPSFHTTSKLLTRSK